MARKLGIGVLLAVTRRLYFRSSVGSFDGHPWLPINVLRCPIRAVQRCRLAVTESALQHLMVEVRWLIARGIPEPAIV